jgi:hypothetical protein
MKLKDLARKHDAPMNTELIGEKREREKERGTSAGM